MKKRILSMILTLSVVLSTMAINPFAASASEVEVLPYGETEAINCAVKGVESTSSLNVRSGPGTSYARIDSLAYNAKFIALVFNRSSLKSPFGGDDWIFIRYTKGGADRCGWVSKTYVNFLGNKTCGMVYGVDPDSRLNVRASASTSATIVGKLNHDTVFIIEATYTDWYYITYDTNKTGYVSKTYVSTYPGHNYGFPS